MRVMDICTNVLISVITIALVIGAVLLLLLTFYTFTDDIDKVNQNRCYNLPLNKFYADNSCLEYKEVLK